jgi:hypothetical protein
MCDFDYYIAKIRSFDSLTVSSPVHCRVALTVGLPERGCGFQPHDEVDTIYDNLVAMASAILLTRTLSRQYVGG